MMELRTQAAAEDPFNTWISEETLAEPEIDAGAEPPSPILPGEPEQALELGLLDQPPDETPLQGIPGEPAPPPAFQESDFLTELQSLSAAQPGETLDASIPAPLGDEDVSSAPVDAQVPDLDAMREKEIYRFDAAPDLGGIEEKPKSFEQAAAHAASKERLRISRQRSWLIPLMLFLILGVIASIAFILNNPNSRFDLAGILPAAVSATPTNTLTPLPSATSAPSLTPT